MSTREDLAPTGTLRAAINLGNPVLATKSPDGDLSGVTVDLARDLAVGLSLPLRLLPFPSGGEVSRQAGNGIWDVAFLAAEPERATQIQFTPPYLVVEGTFLVSEGSAIDSLRDLDRPGNTVSVGDGAAYDLILRRLLKHAELVRSPTSAGAIALFLDGSVTAAAGVRQPLVEASRKAPRTKVLSEAFSRIAQAVALPKGRQTLTYAYVREFCARRKNDGFIRSSLDRHGQAAVPVLLDNDESSVGESNLA